MDYNEAAAKTAVQSCKGGVFMANVLLFLIDGFEEVEALGSVDILRRGGVKVTTTSLSGKKGVISKNGVLVEADTLFEAVLGRDFDELLIPGGTTAYVDHAPFMDYIKAQAGAGKPIAAICAAPVVLGRLGLLRGKTAVCYPGLESELAGATVSANAVEVDGQITTGRGPGLAIVFALRVLEQLQGKAVAQRVAGDFLVEYP
jgi:4-methyl-5(b-hydroxyethyl)-thiazole monophosphate biosynthesis